VVADPDAEHSLSTTLAPVQARIDVSEGRSERGAARAELLRSRLPADVERVLELGCGTGTLLERLATTYDAVGVDGHPALLSFAAARGASTVCGDPTDPPVRPVFDAVCAFDHLTAHRPLATVCAAAYASLRPGGIVVFDALADVRAAASSGVETFRGARYVLERSVDVARSPPEVRDDFRATDRRTGEVGVTSERTALRVVDAASVRSALETAGFEDVDVLDDAGEAGELLATAVRPVETEA
jgi:SAM-dependent methyltransferase